ncbi:MAG: SGNH/GDSL hydrolase family protein, partial [Bdellovibrionales bacterium]|nr:SGNH/GDSL hydrolase family protein [Bdellovibrionales bacterium]
SSFEFADTFSWTRDFAPSNFQVEANSLGFRSPEPPPHGAPDLIVFGDSSSFGWGVEYQDTYTDLVSTILSKRALNFAMPGDSSEFGKLIFDSFAPEYMAQTAIVSFGANDARLSSIPHKALVHEYSEVLWLHALQKGLFKRSELFRKLTDVLTPQPKSPASKVSRGGPAVRLKQYKQNLAYMVRRSRELGAQQVLLLGVCSPSTYLKAMRLTAKRLGAYFVNGQLKMKESVLPLQNGQLFSAESQELLERFGSHIKNQPLLYVTSDGCHPNAIGHKLIAEEIVHALRGPQPEPVKLKKKKRKKRAKHPGRKAKRQKQVSERQKDRRAL